MDEMIEGSSMCDDKQGWREAAIAWEVCASIHREYAKKRDPFFSTRQADFIKHAENARLQVRQYQTECFWMPGG